jgi:acetyl esterase/lipase
VEGIQDVRHLREDEIRPGELTAVISELHLDGPNAFTFEVASNWGHYRYRFDVLQRHATERAAQPLQPAGKISLERVPWQGLSRLTAAHQPRLSGSIAEVRDRGKTLIGTFRFADEDIHARLTLTSEQRGGPQPAARWRNIPYGPHWQHTIDIYPAALAPDATAAPLVVAIHGGGWGALDKDDTFGLQASLPHLGIHFASINYRFIHTAPDYDIEPPVRMPLDDAARAIQTLRWIAPAIGIDPDRIGAIGGSAGGFTALWLALHDDMADPKSPDPIRRQSTRLQTVATIDAQTSLDPLQMRTWIPEITYGAHAFGIYDEAGNGIAFERWLSQREQWLPWIERLSPYHLASVEAPPIFLSYPSRGLTPEPGEQGWAAHAPQFGIHLHQRLRQLGSESYLSYKGAPDPSFGDDYEAFLVTALQREPDAHGQPRDGSRQGAEAHLNEPEP